MITIDATGISAWFLQAGFVGLFIMSMVSLIITMIINSNSYETFHMSGCYVSVVGFVFFLLFELIGIIAWAAYHLRVT